MSLEFFYDESFSLASDLDPVDQLVGTGATATFALTLKSGTDLAATVTVENVQYYQFNGGLTKSGDTFTLSTTPSLNAQIVAPGVIALVLSAFDQLVVDGVDDPTVKEVPFYLGDPDTIHLYDYTNLPQYDGIRIAFVDMVSGSGAELSWVQLACSDAASGLATTYAATGVAIETGAIYASTTLSASASAGSTTISVAAGSGAGFLAGDYVILDIGEGTSEIRKVSSTTGSTITFFTGLEYAHSSSIPVFTMGRKFWAKLTVPENATSSQAFSFWNIGLNRKARIDSKV